MQHKLSTVATFGSPAEAFIACSCIEAEGIKTYLEYNGHIDPDWYLGVRAFGDLSKPRKFNLKVDEENFEQAVDALQTRGEITITEEHWRVEGIAEDNLGELIEERPDSSADKLVERAWRDTILFCWIPPLSFYIAWLVFKVVTDPSPLKKKNYRRLHILLALIYITIIGIGIAMWVNLQK